MVRLENVRPKFSNLVWLQRHSSVHTPNVTERRPDTLGRALVAGLALIAMFDGFFGA
jgi:hypothetical protein